MDKREEKLKGLQEEFDTEKALVQRAAEDWARTFDAITDMIFIIDVNNVIIKANKATFDILKINPDEVIGRKCYEVIHKTTKPWPMCPFEETKSDSFTHAEEVNDLNIGIPLLINISPIFNDNGQLIGAVHVARNISRIKNIEAELKKKVHDLETFFRAAVGREQKIVELKKRIKELEDALGAR